MFDVLVVGGGIIGASAAHHAASAGYRTLLVEQGDYASGTSSRTSRMHNCGFMYFFDAHESLLRFMLKPRQVLSALDLARRTMRDRASLVTTSPDRVRKVDFFIPFDAAGKTSKWKMRVGATLLQALGGNGVSLEPAYVGPDDAPCHPVLSLLQETERRRGGFRFAEYQFNWPERIVVDTILKAREAGAETRNYTKIVGLRQQARVWEATLMEDGKASVVQAKAVINAAGAWVDDVSRLHVDDRPPINSGAKGVNILVRLPDDLRGYGLETVTARGTPFYLFPWGDLHYMGPADVPADASSTEFRATDAEIDEIIDEANKLFAGVRLKREDVIYSWAGVRPRTAAKNQALGSMDVRAHDLTRKGEPAFLAFTGGLIMSHRDAGRRLLRMLKKHVPPSGKARPIDYHLRAQPDEDRVTAQSVRRAVVEEQARCLSDILRRRLSVGWDPRLGLDEVEHASYLAAEVLGWDEARRTAEVAAYRAEVERFYRPAAIAS